MSAPHQTQPDQKRIVTMLADEAHVPVTYVEELYEHERTELAVGAHVMTYLDIFATRNVQEILRRRGRFDQSKPPAASQLMAQ